MEATESLKIIEQMLGESKKNLVRNSFYFILWASLLVPAGIVEWYLTGEPKNWLVWPVVSTIGAAVSMVYGIRQGKKSQVSTAADRISGYTWGSFGFCMLIVIPYAIKLHQPPHALILMLAGGATFISGGISKFKPFIYGGIALEISAILCAFFIDPQNHGLVFSVGLCLGYFIPGIILRKVEHGEA